MKVGQLRYLLEEISQLQFWNEAEKKLAGSDRSSEVAWRTMYYQLESRGVLNGNQIKPFDVDDIFLSIQRSQQDHLVMKMEKLNEVERWIQASTCKRKNTSVF